MVVLDDTISGGGLSRAARPVRRGIGLLAVAEVGGGRSDPDARELLCFRRRRRTSQVASPTSKPIPTTTPTPIPALAPVSSPSSLFCGTAATPEAVGATTVDAAQRGPLPPTKVQLWVAAQHPPPRLLGHAIWLVVHPAGIGDTSDVADEIVGLLVQRHWPVLAQVWP